MPATTIGKKIGASKASTTAKKASMATKKQISRPKKATGKKAGANRPKKPPVDYSTMNSRQCAERVINQASAHRIYRRCFIPTVSAGCNDRLQELFYQHAKNYMYDICIPMLIMGDHTTITIDDVKRAAANRGQNVV